jgi:tetratricopeptide (TPR) repeat protein
MNDRNQRDGGFIFLVGTRNIISGGGTTATAVCPRCGREGDFQNRSMRTWVTFFMIPLFPVSGKQPMCQCSICKARFKGSAEQMQKSPAGFPVQQPSQTQRAIQMYNSLRPSPANSVTLNNLLLLYLQMGELDQAVSAAHQFPDALNASEQCMTSLGRVLLEQGDRPTAIQWFEAAINRNPMLGEAQYCKAITLMGMEPPNLTEAMTAARAARTAGLPEADVLIKELENRARTV